VRHGAGERWTPRLLRAGSVTQHADSHPSNPGATLAVKYNILVLLLGLPCSSAPACSIKHQQVWAFFSPATYSTWGNRDGTAGGRGASVSVSGG